MNDEAIKAIVGVGIAALIFVLAALLISYARARGTQLNEGANTAISDAFTAGQADAP